MNGLSRMILAVVIATAGLLSFAGASPAAEESVSVDATVTPKGALYEHVPRPVDLDLDLGETAPDSSDYLRPSRNIQVDLGKGIEFNLDYAGNKMGCDQAQFYGFLPFESRSGFEDWLAQDCDLSSQVGTVTGSWLPFGKPHGTAADTGAPVTDGIGHIYYVGPKFSPPKSQSVPEFEVLLDSPTTSGVFNFPAYGVGSSLVIQPPTGTSPQIYRQPGTLTDLHLNFTDSPTGNDLIRATCPDGSWVTEAASTLFTARPESPLPPDQLVSAEPASQDCAGAPDPKLDLTVTKTGDGSGSVISDPAGIDCGQSCSGDFSQLSTVTLTANPAAGSSFVGWFGPCSGTGDCRVPMTSSQAVTAKFSKYVPLKVRKAGLGGGTVVSDPGIHCGSDCEDSYPVGSTPHLEARPNNNSYFFGWRGDCGTWPGSPSTECNAYMSSAETAVAIFEPLPPAGPVGISINHGAEFTNSRNVTLSIVWKEGEREATIANDGGFQPGKTVRLREDIPWKLGSGAPERIPKTVYARIEDSTQTMTDDIILDETAPDLSSVSATGGRRVKLTTKASDHTSGVAKIQVGNRKSPKLRKISYRRTVTVPASGKKLWVRVLDRAGNPSKWKRVKVG